MKPPKADECHVRMAEERDYPELERIYLAHEGESLPPGFSDDFRATIRDPAVIYLVATVDDRVVGGGGIGEYQPGVRAMLTFGVVEPAECRKGYGTAIMLSRLLFVDPGIEGCQILLEATGWSADFFNRLGFSWYWHEEDGAGNVFLSGSHMVYPRDGDVFRRILDDGRVSLGFAPDRPSAS